MVSNQFVIMDGAAKANVAAIYAHGQKRDVIPIPRDIGRAVLIIPLNPSPIGMVDTYVLSPNLPICSLAIDYYGSFNNCLMSVRGVTFPGQCLTCSGQTNHF